MSEDEERGGKQLSAGPGPRFQALVTSLPKTTHTPRCGWPHHHGRADGENVSKELQAGLALPTLCLEEFWASEAALSLACLTCNLVILFERHLGWQQKVTPRDPRFWRFVTAGVLSHPAGQTQAGRARAGTRLAAAFRGEAPEPAAQLQGSRKPPRVHRLIRLNI